MKNDTYVYPAILTYDVNEKEIAVEIRDLDVATSGLNDYDAFKSARELLTITLEYYKEENIKPPKPTSLSNIKLNNNEKTILVDAVV